MKPLLRALGFLSSLPLGSSAQFQTRQISGLLACFPLAGALLGGALGCFHHGAALCFNTRVAAALTVIAWVALTRAFHLDGLADCADGLGGAFTREKRLAIMKDPHVGVFGTAAIVCVLLLKFSVLDTLTHTNLQEDALRLALVLSAARFGVLIGAYKAHYARHGEGGLGRDFLSAARGWTLVAGAIVPLALGILWTRSYQGIWVIATVVTTALLVRLVFNRAIGGQTGDTLGATVELGEVAALLMV